MYYIGIDGGGTKTRFTLFNEAMKELDHCVLSTCHFAQVGYQCMEEILKEGIHILKERYQLTDYGIGYGLAGYGKEKEIRSQIETIVERVSDQHPFILVNDVESAVAGALNLQDGIVVIAGTGSIAFGVCGKLRMRCGGWGYQIGDEGSAYWLGKKLLEVFSKQADGRCEKTQLYDLVRKHTNLMNDHDIISYIRDAHNERGSIAELAVLLTQAANQKDPYAIAMYQEAAKELSCLVEAIKIQLFPQHASVPVSYIGGVFRAERLIIEPLSRNLSSGCLLKSPIYGPDKGVCLLLKQKLNNHDL